MSNQEKLVRDLIPNIIRNDGATPKIRIASKSEYILRLGEKLKEEVSEFLENGNLEELADIMEVVFALAEQGGVSKTELEKIRIKKATSRGGFKKRVVLKIDP